MSKAKKPICKRTDKGVVALWFDNQEGKYFSDPYPASLEKQKDCELNDPSPRYSIVAYVEVDNDERGYPKPGKQVF